MSSTPARLVELQPQECIAHLERGGIGRVSFCDDRGPVVMPVNFAFVEGDVWFRTATGAKFAAAVAHAFVAFEIDGIDPMYHGGWDVLVRGTAEHVETPPAMPVRLQPWAPPERNLFVRIRPEEVTGRRILN